MKVLLIFLFAFVCVISSYKLKTIPAQKFAEYAKPHEFHFVLFTSEDGSCPTCPTTEILFETVTNNASVSHVPFSKVNCAADHQFCTTQKVVYIPSGRLYMREKSFRDYPSTPKPDKVAQWIVKNTQALTTKLTSKVEIEQFVADHKGKALIGYFTAPDDAEHKAFKGLLMNDPIFAFYPAGEVFSSELAASVGGAPALQLFRTFGPSLTLAGSELKNARVWMNAHAYKPFTKLSTSNTLRFTHAGIPVAIVYHRKFDQDLVKLFESVGTETAGKFAWTYSELKEEDSDVFYHFGLDPTKPPLIIVFKGNFEHPESTMPYVYLGKLEKHLLVQWANGVLDGSVFPHSTLNEHDEL